MVTQRSDCRARAYCRTAFDKFSKEIRFFFYYLSLFHFGRRLTAQDRFAYDRYSGNERGTRELNFIRVLVDRIKRRSDKTLNFHIACFMNRKKTQ